MKKWFIVLFFLTTAFVFCQQSVQISAQGAIGRVGTILSEPYYTGDGGKGIQLAVLMPQLIGNVPEYLPLYIQGLLISNFAKFSAMTVSDRQYVNKIVTGQNLGVNGMFSKDDLISIGKITGANKICSGNVQRISDERFLLQLSIDDLETSGYTGTGFNRFSFLREGSFAQLEGSGELVNDAASNLLGQIGVTLNDTGKKTLLTGNSPAVKAASSFARGVHAQEKGLLVQALLYFSSAVSFNSSQADSKSRLNEVSAAISGGQVREDTQKDRQARERWLEIFKETARFFNAHQPFEIIFDPNLIQESAPDYVNRTVNLAMRVVLDPSKSGFDALNTLLDGLEKTGKRAEWGFSGWPLLYVNPRVYDAVVFYGKKTFRYNVDVALLNKDNRTIGRGSIALSVGALDFALGDKKVPLLAGDAGMVRFSNVNIDALSKNLTIVITYINGIPSSEFTASGSLKIDTEDLEKRVVYKIGFRGPAGGIIFYDKGKYTDGWRYLEAAPNDLGYAAWGADGKDIPGTDIIVGSGKKNTQIIIERLKALGETGKAAQLCAGLNINGFTDWFLPSKNELNLMYQNLQVRGMGGFNGNWYWTSSQDNKNKHTWNQYFRGNGDQHLNAKFYTLSIRPIRAF
jgi:hypothetical protein